MDILVVFFSTLVYKMSGLFKDVSGAAHGVESWVEQQWAIRMVQVSVYAGIVFFILSSYDLIDIVDKTVNNVINLKLGKDGTRALHGVIFALFMYVGTRFLLDPVVTRLHLGGGKVVEGADVEDDVEGEYEEGMEEEGGEGGVVPYDGSP